MGQPKLLLPWPKGNSKSIEKATQQDSPASILDATSASQTVIDRVLEAWTTSQVIETIVVVRNDDSALRDACNRWPVTVVHPPTTTHDMKGSVCVGLQFLIDKGVLTGQARCFIAPADLPELKPQVIDRLIEAQTDARMILIPRFGRSLETSVTGHPVLLPWEFTNEILTLGPQEGVNTVVKRHPQEFVLLPPELTVKDFDTPSEYHAILESARFLP